MTILDVIRDPNLFRPFLGEDLQSWGRWAVALRALYGLPVKNPKARELITQCTGRDPDELPPDGFRTALFLCGRRSGKSKIAALIAGYEALFAGHEKKLSRGEVGIIPVLAPTKFQAGLVWKYIQGLFETPLLARQVIDTRENPNDRSIRLSNRVEVRVMAGDYRSVRGITALCVVIDEAAFFGLDTDSKIRSDAALIAAIRPSLASTNGRLIAISTKYARRGWCYSQWQRQHGSNRGVSPGFVEEWGTLLWDCPSRTMNTTLDQRVIDAAMKEDPAAASEFLGRWREDVSEFVPRSLVESLVHRGRKELSPRKDRDYFAFVDLSGGRADDASLAIAHREGRKVVLDLAKLWRSPFNPHLVISEMAEELKRFGLSRTTGDNYSGEFVAGAFRSHGISYHKSPLPKSELYRELLPRLCSAEIVLLDDPKLIDQLSSLERRTRSGGRDVIDHPPNGKDDLANAVAGVAVNASRPRRRVGGFSLEPRLQLLGMD